jgi:hypothetical protein
MQVRFCQKASCDRERLSVPPITRFGFIPQQVLSSVPAEPILWEAKGIGSFVHFLFRPAKRRTSPSMNWPPACSVLSLSSQSTSVASAVSTWLSSGRSLEPWESIQCVSCGSSTARQLENRFGGDSSELRRVCAVQPLEEDPCADSAGSQEVCLASRCRILHNLSPEREEARGRERRCSYSERICGKAAPTRLGD